MTDRSLIDKVAEAITSVDGHVLPPETAVVLAQAAIDALQLTRQTREVWPSEESGMSGPLHQTCWQTPWVGG